jgi:hypothetical protein
MPKKQQSETLAEPALQRVGACLYRNQTSGTYYAWVKRAGKQIKRSLKRKGRKLAQRRLAGFQATYSVFQKETQIRLVLHEKGNQDGVKLDAQK